MQLPELKNEWHEVSRQQYLLASNKPHNTYKQEKNYVGKPRVRNTDVTTGIDRTKLGCCFPKRFHTDFFTETNMN